MPWEASVCRTLLEVLGSLRLLGYEADNDSAISAMLLLCLAEGLGDVMPCYIRRKLSACGLGVRMRQAGKLTLAVWLLLPTMSGVDLLVGFNRIITRRLLVAGRCSMVDRVRLSGRSDD